MRRSAPCRVRSCSVPSALLRAPSSALRRDHQLRARSGCIRHRRRRAPRSSEHRKRVRGPNRNRPAPSFHCRHQGLPNRRPTLSRRRTHNRPASPRRANSRRSARRWPATRCRRFRALSESERPLVHELLHPSQVMRTLAEIGKTEAPDSEARVQMREQKIAQELGKTPGKDFPDVFESGPYGVRLAPAETQPRSTSPDNSAPSVAPMKYGAGTPFSDNPNPWDDIFGNRISSLGGFAPRNPNGPALPAETQGPIASISGKPTRFLFAPIFQTRTPSDGGPDRRSVLDDLLWNGLRSRAISSDADTAQPLLPDRRISSAFRDESDSSPTMSPGLVPPMPVAPEDSQEPLSLNDACLEYLRRLGLNQS